MKNSKHSETPSDKLFAVMDCIAGSRSAMSVTEISGRLSLPVPTVHRIAVHLSERGYLKRAPGSKRFRIGPRLTALGVRAMDAAFAADRPHAILVSLARKLNEHCQIGVVADDQVVYVDSASANRSSGLLFQPGHSAPIYCTSIGKLHLAHLTEDDLAHVLSTLAYQRFTPNTICGAKAAAAEAYRVRRRGWAATNAEYTPGVVGCAVPIYDARGRMIAGLGLSAPQAHVSIANVRSFIPAMQDAARRIAEAALDDADEYLLDEPFARSGRKI